VIKFVRLKRYHNGLYFIESFFDGFLDRFLIHFRRLRNKKILVKILETFLLNVRLINEYQNSKYY